MSPEAIQAIDQLVHTLNEMNLPALIAAIIFAFIIAPIFLGTMVYRIMNSLLVKNAEQLNNAHTQLSTSLGLTGASVHNTELLRTSMDSYQGELKDLAGVIMSSIKTEIEQTKDAILAKLALARGVLDDLPGQIDAGFEKATEASSGIQEGVTELLTGQRALAEGMGKLLDYALKRGNLDDEVLSQMQSMADSIGHLDEGVNRLMVLMEQNRNGGSISA